MGGVLDFRLEPLAFRLEESMEEVNGHSGAERYARSDARLSQRNGYRGRPLGGAAAVGST